MCACQHAVLRYLSALVTLVTPECRTKKKKNTRKVREEKGVGREGEAESPIGRQVVWNMTQT